MTDDRITRTLFEFSPKIRAYFARRISNPQDIEDLCSEVALAITEGLSRFNNESSLSTWIFAICRHVFSHHVYYRERDRKLSAELQTQPGSPSPSPDSRVTRLLARLSEHDQKLYQLYYVEGYSVRELSTMLKRPEGTVKYHLSELRSRFREMLA